MNNAPEWAGRLWIEWTSDIGHSRRLSISAESTAQSTVFYTPFNDSIQKQSPYAGRPGPSRQFAVEFMVRR